MVERVEGAVGEGPYIGIGTVLRFAFEGTDHFLMVVDHFIDVGLVAGR